MEEKKVFDYFEDDPSFPVSKSERFHFLPKLEMVELYETTKPYLFTSSKMPYSDIGTVRQCQFSKQLPFGYEEVRDRFTQQIYYADHFTATIGTEKPSYVRKRGFFDFFPGWSRFIMFSAGRRKLFYYHIRSNCYQWMNPNLMRRNLIRFSLHSMDKYPLSDGWKYFLKKEVVNGNETYIPLFVHFGMNITSWVDPRTTCWKQALVRNQFDSNHQIHTSFLMLGGENLLMDLFEQLKYMRPYELHPLRFKCLMRDDNRPIDMSGLSKVLINKCVYELVRPRLDLFFTVSGKYSISPDKFNDPVSLKLLFVFGRLLAIALFQNVVLNTRFAFEFLVKLTQEQINEFEFIRILEPSIHGHLVEENPSDEIFSYVTFDALCHRDERVIDPEDERLLEAKRNKVPFDYSTIPTRTFDFEFLSEELNINTLDLFNAYKRLTVYFHTKFRIGAQMAAVKNGIKDIIPTCWLKLFYYSELDVTLSGEDYFCVENWYKYTLFFNVPEEKKIYWHDFLVKMKEEKKDRQLIALLKFTTGQDRVPIGGFGNFSIQFKVNKTSDGQDIASRENKIRSHTCFNQLDIADSLWENYELFHTNLLNACNTFIECPAIMETINAV